MSVTLTSQEIAILKKDYRMAVEPTLDSTYSIPSKDLLNEEKCLRYLQEIAPIFDSSSLLATSSLFAKRYSFLTMASGLYAMSRLHKGLDVSLGNSWVESSYQGELWLPSMRLVDWSVSQPEKNRTVWRDQIIHTIFADNLAAIWKSVAATAKISKAVLWENTAIYVHWLYETKLRENASEQEIVYIEEDYHYLMFQAPAELFGERKNPLARFNNPKVIARQSDTPIRLRKTCCFYYLTSDEAHDYCITCPKITT